MSCHSLLQEIFLTQGLNPDLPHFRQILYHLSHQGSPIYMCVCVYVYIYIYIYNFQRSRIGHIYIYTHTYICIYICIWLYTHIYTYICDYIHTHTHIWVLSGSLCNSSVKHKTIHINSSSSYPQGWHLISHWSHYQNQDINIGTISFGTKLTYRPRSYFTSFSTNVIFSDPVLHLVSTDTYHVKFLNAII